MARSALVSILGKQYAPHGSGGIPVHCEYARRSITRTTSVVASLAVSVTMFVCVQPALGPRVAARSPAPAAPFNPLLDALDRLDDLEATVGRLQSHLADERIARQRADQVLAGVNSSSVSGGEHNNASGDYSSVSGGGSDKPDLGNQAIGDYSSVSGGQHNGAVGNWSSVSGGLNRAAFNIYNWVAGMLKQDS